jgi:dTDP-4-amino-4,6-dideoxygalactose transaminase
MNKIKFINLFRQIKDFKQEIFDLIKKNIEASTFVGGSGLKKFEKNFSNYIGIKYALGVANGTDALEIAIKTLNLKKDSEILVPANTWISTAEAVLNNNYSVKFVDIGNDHNICTNDLKKKISKKTKVIIAVHLYGNPSNIIEIRKICKNNKIYLIEDCAQAHGATVGGKKVGTFGDISTFSFFPTKNLGCFGDGGMIVTNNKKFFLLSKKIANHGGLKKNIHEIIGRNSRLDNIQAQILDVKLKKLDNWLRHRNNLANTYYKLLKNIKDIQFIQKTRKNYHSYHLFVIKTKSRNKLAKYLKKKNIETFIHYPLSLPTLKIFKKEHFHYCKNMDALTFNNQILSLPMGEHLNYKDISFICKKIISFYQ